MEVDGTTGMHALSVGHLMQYTQVPFKGDASGATPDLLLQHCINLPSPQELVQARSRPTSDPVLWDASRAQPSAAADGGLEFIARRTNHLTDGHQTAIRVRESLTSMQAGKREYRIRNACAESTMPGRGGEDMYALHLRNPAHLADLTESCLLGPCPQAETRQRRRRMSRSMRCCRGLATFV